MRCDLCDEKKCNKGEPCMKKNSAELYADPIDRKFMQTAGGVEAEFYGDLNRMQEIVVFAKRMGYKKIGLAFCVGLSGEAKKFCEFLSQYFEISAVCCKTCGMEKSELDIPMSDRVGPVSCNPAEQARMLKEDGTELNLMLGLCVGHDAMFIKHSHTYVIPVAVKDRVLGHNPLAAVYCKAVYGKMEKTDLGKLA